MELSVCIECFWRDVPHAERIRRIAALGYRWAEFWGWSGKDLAAIATACSATGVKIAGLCLESKRGLLDPLGRDELLAGLDRSLAAARTVGADTLIVTAGDIRPGESFETTRRTAVRNLRALAPGLEAAGITLVLEPLNDRVDHKGHWLTRMVDAADIAREVGSPRVKLLMDLYHQQVTEGDLIAHLTADADLIAHYHCAGVPGRHEPDACEVDYRQVMRAIAATGYARRVGLEFFPTVDDAQALTRARALLPAP